MFNSDSLSSHFLLLPISRYISWFDNMDILL